MWSKVTKINPSFKETNRMTSIKTKTEIATHCILNASLLYCFYNQFTNEQEQKNRYRPKKLRQYVKKNQMTIKTDVRTK